MTARRKGTGPRKTGGRRSGTADDPARPRSEEGVEGGGRLGRVQDRVLDAFAAIESGAPADRALEGLFRRARDLGPAERAEVSDTVYGLLRARRRLEDRLVRAAKTAGRPFELLDAPLRARMLLLALHAENGAGLEDLRNRDPYAVRRIPGVFERLTKGRTAEPKRSNLAEEIGVRWSLPDWVAERLLVSAGGDAAAAEAIARELSGRAPLTLRVNTLRASREEARERIAREHGIEAEPTPLAPHGLILPRAAGVHRWPLYEEGWLEVQDEASQLAVLAAGARPHQTVIDACAGAGGKTLALAAAMEGTGRIVAIDPEKSRLEELMRRARRAGISSHETLAIDFGELPERYVARADRVLIDAPCTGTGIHRRQPDAIWRLGTKELEQLTQLQIRLLLRAVDAVKPGGLIAYATCSVLRDEDEAIVETALARDGRLQPHPLADTLGPELAAKLGATTTARIGPGPTDRGPDGFFIALFKRRES